MKKTVRINISGIIFNIDEDAYEKLQHYLNSITRQFFDSNEGNEIIADVESRIAELFQERIGDKKEVINLPDIDFVIEIMGKPEDFEEQELEEETEAVEMHYKKGNRRIYRDPDNRIISGLSAGLAAYFNIDPIIIRVIFVLMTIFYGTSLLIYIILWIAIPEAKTRSQKLEMRGQDINLSNIQTSIKSEFNQVKSNFNNWQRTKNYDRLRENTGEALNFFWKMFLLAGKIVLILFGIFFLIMGILTLGGMTGLYFFDNTILSPLSWQNVSFSVSEFTSLFTDNYTARVIMITSYLLVLIPVLSIIYFGLRFIFKFKTKNKYIGLYIGAMWIVSLIVLIVSGVKIAYGIRANEELTQSYKIENKSTDTLYIALEKDQFANDWNDHKARFGNIELEFDENGSILKGEPDLTIQKNDNNSSELFITKFSHGINNQEAIKFAKNIQYEWQQDDSVLNFHRYFQINGEKKIRNQRVSIVLKIPVGKVIYLGKGLEELCSYFEVENYSCYEMPGHYWIMTETGLKLYGEKDFGVEDESEMIENEQVPDDSTKIGIKKEIEDMKAELDSM